MFIEPLTSAVSNILGVLSVLVGGIFDIYVITLIIRIVFFQKLLSDYKQIKKKINLIEHKLDELLKKKK